MEYHREQKANVAIVALYVHNCNRAIRAFAKKMLSLFGSTYLREKTFSVMNLNKSRVRTRLTDSHLRDTLRINNTADLAFVLQSRSQYHPSD